MKNNYLLNYTFLRVDKICVVRLKICKAIIFSSALGELNPATVLRERVASMRTSRSPNGSNYEVEDCKE